MKKTGVLLSIVIFAFTLHVPAAVSGQWTRVSGVTGGTIWGMASYGSDLYVISNPYGVFRSSDGGGNWIHCAAIDAKHFMLSTVFADSVGVYVGSMGGGAFRSTDRGESWVKLDVGNQVNSFAKFVLVGSVLWACANDEGIYASTDDGSTWAPRGNLDSVSCSSIVFDGNTVLVGAGVFGVYASTNTGSTWSHVWSPIRPYDNTTMVSDFVNWMAVKDGYVFAATSYGGVYRSSDHGNNWEQASQGLTTGNVRTLFVFGGNLFAGTPQGVFRSTDDGGSWSAVNNGLTAAYVGRMAGVSDTLFAGTAGWGVYRSTDSGSSWEASNNGLSCDRVIVNGLETVTAAGGQDYLFVATYGAGLFVSGDEGATWARTGLLDANITLLQSSGSAIYAATSDSGVFMSTDYGATWLHGGTSLGYLNALAVSGSDIYGGVWDYALTNNRSGIYRSTDSTSTWTKTDNGVTNLQLDALAASDSLVAAGCWGGGDGLFVSTNYGADWSPATTNLPNDTIQALTILSLPSSKIVLASVWDEGVYRSSDYGQTWHQANNGITDNRILSFAASDTGVLARGDSTLFISTDDGVTWTLINGGLTGMTLAAAAMTEHHAVLATTDKGIYERSLAGITEVNRSILSPVAERYKLRQNYPNPFNPQTTITYDVRRQSRVKMIVYDVLGRKVATLVDGVRAPGEYSVNFDGSRLSSGVYFCRMDAGRFTATMKLMLLK